MGQPPWSLSGRLTGALQDSSSTLPPSHNPSPLHIQGGARAAMFFHPLVDGLRQGPVVQNRPTGTLPWDPLSCSGKTENNITKSFCFSPCWADLNNKAIPRCPWGGEWFQGSLQDTKSMDAQASSLKQIRAPRISPCFGSSAGDF